MSTDARPSQKAEPVSWCSPTPANASSRPISAALSSKNTVLTVGSSVWRNQASGVVSSRRASLRSCRTACTHEVPSSRNETPRTA